MKIKLKIVAAMIAMSGFGMAHAEFKVISGDQQLQPAAVAPAMTQVPEKAFSVPAGVSQIGEPKGVQPVSQGFGKEVSLLNALKSIVPAGWKAKRAGGLDVSIPVSWKGEGKVWYETLHTLALNNSFNAEVNWNTKEVIVSPANAVVKPTVLETTKNVKVTVAEESVVKANSAVQEIEKKEEPQMKPMVEEPVVAKVTVVPEKAYVIDTTLSLRENVEHWAKQEGWEVSWVAADYPSVRGTFYGSLTEVKGVMHQLAIAYATAKKPFSVSISEGNKIIRVENNSWKQVPMQDEAYPHRLGRDVTDDSWRK